MTPHPWDLLAEAHDLLYEWPRDWPCVRRQLGKPDDCAEAGGMDLAALDRGLARMEAADPKLKALGDRVRDVEHYLATGEEVGSFARERRRARRLAVMHARRRLWPSRSEEEG